MGFHRKAEAGGKFATGEITFSSAVNTFTVEHGLGAEPKYVFLIGIKTSSNDTYYKVTSGYKDNESSRIIAMQLYGDGSGKFGPAAAVSGELNTSTFAGIEADATNITIPVSYIYVGKVYYIGT